MRTYPLLTADRAHEMADAIRGRDWQVGKTLGGLSDVKVCGELRQDSGPDVKVFLDEILEKVTSSPIYQREMLDTAFYPRFSRYADGGQYQTHVDAAYMGPVRTDLAMTLFLNDDYEGGELQVEMAGGQMARVKAPAGHAVVYECWRPHRVTPVTSGERLVAVTWFQSKVPDTEDREILDRLHRVIDELRPGITQEQFASLGCVFDKLFKRFSTH